jgi:CheY-like chemotaxis protein
VGDGEQAMRFLRRTGEFTGAPRPGLILLDLNLPGRNGLEVLAELKAVPRPADHPRGGLQHLGPGVPARRDHDVADCAAGRRPQA